MSDTQDGDGDSPRKSDPIDHHVGQRLRMRRMLLGMSQEALGHQLGLTFQQVQKYEKGANRISAGRLLRMSKALGVSINYFFEDLPAELFGPDGALASPSVDLDLWKRPDLIELAKAFDQIENASLRRAIVNQVIATASSLEGRKSST